MLGTKRTRKKRITQRDLKILKLCQEQRYLTLAQIAMAFFPGSKNKYKVPLRCVNRLMKRGLLRAIKERIGKRTLYLVSRKGMRTLEGEGFLNGLAYVKTVDWANAQHDSCVTDIRLIFEKLGFEWTPQRVLKLSNPRKKFPDGKATFGEYAFSVDVEKDRLRRDEYKWIFGKRCRERHDRAILYVVKDERTKAKRLKDAKDLIRIYCVTLDEVLERQGEALFLNCDDMELILSRVVNPAEPATLDQSLEPFRKADRGFFGTESNGRKTLPKGGVLHCT